MLAQPNTIATRLTTILPTHRRALVTVSILKTLILSLVQANVGLAEGATGSGVCVGC